MAVTGSVLLAEVSVSADPASVGVGVTDVSEEAVVEATTVGVDFVTLSVLDIEVTAPVESVDVLEDDDVLLDVEDVLLGSVGGGGEGGTCSRILLISKIFFGLPRPFLGVTTSVGGSITGVSTFTGTSSLPSFSSFPSIIFVSRR